MEGERSEENAQADCYRDGNGVQANKVGKTVMAVDNHCHVLNPGNPPGVHQDDIPNEHQAQFYLAAEKDMYEVKE